MTLGLVRLFSITGPDPALRVAPLAGQQALLSLWLTQWLASADPTLLLSPPPLSSLLTIRLFSTSVSLLLFRKWLICTIFLDSTHSDSMYVSFAGFLHIRQSLCPSTLLQMTSFHSFLWLSSSPSCVCTLRLHMHSPVHGR